MNIVNKVKVTICGKEYNLRTDDSAEYITALAARTDKAINELLKLKPDYGVYNAAVFVALTSLDEAQKSAQGMENMRRQIKSAVGEAAKARSAKEKLTAKVSELEGRIKELQGRIDELEKENKELMKRPVPFECEQLMLENTEAPAAEVCPVNGDKTEQKQENAEKDAAAPANENAAEENPIIREYPRARDYPRMKDIPKPKPKEDAMPSESPKEEKADEQPHSEPKADGVSSGGERKTEKEEREHAEGSDKSEAQTNGNVPYVNNGAAGNAAPKGIYAR